MLQAAAVELLLLEVLPQLGGLALCPGDPPLTLPVVVLLRLQEVPLLPHRLLPGPALLADLGQVLQESPTITTLTQRFWTQLIM